MVKVKEGVLRTAAREQEGRKGRGRKKKKKKAGGGAAREKRLGIKKYNIELERKDN